ncbi:MAG: chondroitin 4-sulfotransferase 11 [Saprospiraceae bacterium]|jgi:hypothetical protein
MLISHKYEFVFIHVHRTGGTSIINLLKRELGNDVDEISEHGNVNSSEQVLIDKYPNYRIIGFVRNPWARILSWYSLINKWNDITIEESRKEYQDFLEFRLAAKPDDRYFHYNQLDYFPDVGDRIVEFYQFENFEMEAKRILGNLSLGSCEIPVTNKTKTKIYQDFYTKESRDLILEICNRDIAYFKYDF